MPTMGYPLDAFLLVDNNVVVSLYEFYCDAYKHRPFPEMIQLACHEVSAVFDKLRLFALGNKIFTTDCVQGEFLPERGTLSTYPGFVRKNCESLKAHLRGEIEAVRANLEEIHKLRAMRQAPSKFGIELKNLSDPDLSLVILALEMATRTNRRVYILTDEVDLRDFVSWMKSKPEVKAMCACPHQIDALHSMSYLDSAHRHCAFPTEQIYEMLSFLLLSQRERGGTLLDSTKGKMITYSLQSIYKAVRDSSAEKKRNAMGGAAV